MENIIVLYRKQFKWIMKTKNPINNKFTEYNICFYVVLDENIEKKDIGRNNTPLTKQVYVGFVGDSIDPILELKNENGDSELYLGTDIKEKHNIENFNCSIKHIEDSDIEGMKLNYEQSKRLKRNDIDFKNEHIADILKNIYGNENIGGI